MARTAEDIEAAVRRIREPAVAVAVVNYNGGERVMRVLEALHRQRYPLEEIVVVDNASSDGSRERIRRAWPRVRIVALRRNMGASTARNAGLRSLRSPIALLLDHDVYVRDDCIGKLVRALKAHRSTVVCPRIRLVPEREIVQADGAAMHFLGTQVLRHAYRPVDRAPEAGGDVDGCISACLLVDRREVLRAGAFDDLYFFYFEDLEFSLRMRASGHRIWCEPAAVAFHERAAGTPQLSFRGHGPYPPARAYYTMRNRLLTLLIHYRPRTLLMLAPVLFLHELACFAVACTRGWLLQWLRAWGWVFANVPAIARRRRRMRRLRAMDDRDLLVGGPPPLAPAFLRSATEKRLMSWYSVAVNGYWNLARGWIG
jgi:GT2 family glycosyltransferase